MSIAQLKYFLFPVVYGAVIFWSSAQQIEWGKEYTVTQVQQGTYDHFLQKNPSHYYGIRQKKGYIKMLAKYDWYLASYYSDFNLDTIVPLFPAGYFDETKNFPRTIDAFFPAVHGKNYLFYSLYEPGRFFSFYVAGVDDQFHFTGNPVRLDHSSEDRHLPVQEYNIVLSRDSSRFLLWHSSAYVLLKPKKIRFCILNAKTLETEFEKEIVLNVTSENFRMVTAAVSPDDHVYLLYRKRTGSDSFSGITGPGFYYNLVRFPLSDEEPVMDYAINLNEKYINLISMSAARHTITVAGFYGLRNRHAVSGTFFISINQQSGEVTRSVTRPLPVDFIRKFNRKKSIKAEIPHMELRDLSVDEEGYVTMIAEQHLTKEDCYRDVYGRLKCVTYTHFNDLMVVRLNPEGEPEWYRKIPKKCVETEGGTFPGTAIGKTDDCTYLFFNDHVANLRVDSTHRTVPLRYMNKSAIVMVKVGKDGNVTKQVLEYQKGASVFFKPLASFQNGNHPEMIFFACGKDLSRKEKMGRFVLPR